MSDDCVFCRELRGSRDTNFASRYPELKSRIIFETESLVAFPCIGQLVEGHFLVIPRKHYCTFAQTQIHLTSLSTELQTLLQGVHKNLNLNINESLFFEHGALTSENGGCGIYHAHLHVVPHAGKIHPLEVFDFSNKPFKGLESAFHSISPESSYVIAGNMNQGFYHSTINAPLASQTLRKTVATLLNVTQWDWRSVMREPSVLAMINRV